MAYTLADAKQAGKSTVNVKEAADILGIGENLCYRELKARRIPALKFGSKYLIPVIQLEKMLSGEEVATVGQNGKKVHSDLL